MQYKVMIAELLISSIANAFAVELLHYDLKHIITYCPTNKAQYFTRDKILCSVFQK